MMVMTAKLNLKKILLILTAAAAVVLSLILVLGGSPKPAEAAQGQPVSGNEARVKFLEGLGWDITETPTESTQVRVPKQTSQIYERYNNLQKSQGYDLTQYAGKKVMRYVYQVNNYPGATDPVYATVLVCDDRIIGGDITDTGAGGKIRGFQPMGVSRPRKLQPAQTTPPASEETQPSTVSGLPQ